MSLILHEVQKAAFAFDMESYEFKVCRNHLHCCAQSLHLDASPLCITNFPLCLSGLTLWFLARISQYLPVSLFIPLILASSVISRLLLTPSLAIRSSFFQLLSYPLSLSLSLRLCLCNHNSSSLFLSWSHFSLSMYIYISLFVVALNCFLCLFPPFSLFLFMSSLLTAHLSWLRSCLSIGLPVEIGVLFISLFSSPSVARAKVSRPRLFCRELLQRKGQNTVGPLFGYGFGV